MFEADNKKPEPCKTAAIGFGVEGIDCVDKLKALSSTEHITCLKCATEALTSFDALDKEAKRLTDAISGYDIVFIICKMKKDAAHVMIPGIAAKIRATGCLTLGLCLPADNMPGNNASRHDNALMLKNNVDTLFELSNTIDAGLVYETVKRLISDIMGIVNHVGLINVDLDDLKTVLSNTSGSESGENGLYAYGDMDGNVNDVMDNMIVVTEEPYMPYTMTTLIISFNGSFSLETVTVISERIKERFNAKYCIFGISEDESIPYGVCIFGKEQGR
ncbi:MAG: hypothetical protein K6E85_01290 [Lachnospiraceae bacterium]|nr:hypothetical protein [Lachnospiraceae bacterium]